MSANKFFYSLPKTQPTSSSSSSKNKLNQTLNFKGYNQKTYLYSGKAESSNKKHQPEVSQFQLFDLKEEKYVHKLNIDYGKLQKPFNTFKQGQILKSGFTNQLDRQITLMDNLHHDLNSLLSTKRLKNIKNYTQQDMEYHTQRNAEQPPVHSLLTHKKVFSTSRILKNPESDVKTSTLKKKNRIISVQAYEKMNGNNKFNQLQTDRQKQHRQVQEIEKTLKTQQNLKSSRKISHSRIIKTFNPIGGMQMKIITYPDMSDVIKVKQIRRK